MSKRMVVTGVTINVADSSGKSYTYTIDPNETEALFWSDRAVKEMLAPFYNTINKSATLDELKDGFGDSVTSLPLNKNSDGSVKITPQLVAQLWELEDSDGNKVPVIKKPRKCIPQGTKPLP